jgi:hypothetical protein
MFPSGGLRAGLGGFVVKSVFTSDMPKDCSFYAGVYLGWSSKVALPFYITVEYPEKPLGSGDGSS